MSAYSFWLPDSDFISHVSGMQAAWLCNASRGLIDPALGYLGVQHANYFE